MNATLKWKLVVGFILAFLAGCATGAFFAASHSHHLHNLALHRYSLADRMRHRIQTQLDLTPAQIEKIGPIFDQAANELQKIRTETGAHVRQVITETERALAPQLTPEQRKRLEQHRARISRSALVCEVQNFRAVTGDRRTTTNLGD